MRLVVWRLALRATRRLPMPVRAEIVNFIANVGRGWL